MTFKPVDLPHYNKQSRVQAGKAALHTLEQKLNIINYALDQLDDLEQIDEITRKLRKTLEDLKI